MRWKQYTSYDHIPQLLFRDLELLNFELPYGIEQLEPAAS